MHVHYVENITTFVIQVSKLSVDVILLMDNDKRRLKNVIA